MGSINIDNELLQAIIDAPNIGLAIYKAIRDDDGRITDFVHEYVNHRTVEALGSDFTGKLLSGHGPDGLKQIGLFRQVVETQKPNSYILEPESGVVFGWFRFSNALLPGDRLVHIWEDISDIKKAERETTENRNLLQAILDSSLYVMQAFKAVRDTSGKIVDFTWVFVNNKWKELYGGEMVGKSLLKENPAVVVTGLFDKFVHVTETGIATEFDHYYAHEQFNAWFHQTHVKLGDGFLLTAVDITESKKAAQEVLRLKDEIAQAATDKYRTLFNSMDEGFAVIDLILDENGKPVDTLHLEANPAYERHTGLYNIVGKRGLEVMPSIGEWLNFYGDIARTGEAMRLEYYVEHINRWLTCYVSRIGGAGSLRLAVVFNDITERKLAEQRQTFLLKLADELSRLDIPDDILTAIGAYVGPYFDLSTCVFADVDLGRELILVQQGWNREDVPSLKQTFRMRNYLTEEFVRAGRWGVPMIIRDTAADPRVNAAAYARLKVGAFVIIPFHQAGIWTHFFAASASSPRNWSTADIALFQEISDRVFPRIERARAEEALRKSEQQLKRLLIQRDEFIGVASHELKTPITSMKAYAEIILERLSEPGGLVQPRLVQKLDAQIDRVSDLINHLLDTTRIAEGNLILEFELLDINQLVSERIEEIRYTTKATLNLTAGDLPPVVADRERVGQVITNFLSNAIKYSPKDSTIEIVTSSIDDGIRVGVKDQGVGISKADQEKIFERFFRVSENDMDTYPGMGLGLYIVDKIIQRHHGAISVQSELGKGSTFSFTLPLKQ